jgi:DNA replication protein DnaC
MSTEAAARRQRYLKTRLQPAHLAYIKTFDQFDFAFRPSIDERQVREPCTLRFVHEASNVILLRPPGVGCQYRLKNPHYSGRKFPSPRQVVVYSFGW